MPRGALFCHAKNMNTNGTVMTAVAIRTGWKAVGSISTPARRRKGIGKTVKSQKETRIARIILLRRRRVRPLILVTRFRWHVTHLVVELLPETSAGTMHDVHTFLSQK